MNIVIEGPDATGKSTLARYIAQHTGMAILESEGPPRRVGDIADRIERRLVMDDTIFVRHPVVSHPIYEAARAGGNSPSTEVVGLAHHARFYHSNILIIYCKPDQRLLSHVVKPHDSPEHVAMIEYQREFIEAMYQGWAIKHANLIYKIGDDQERVLRYINMGRSFDPVRDVENFHVKNQINYDGKPRALDFETLQFRLKFMREELGEFETHGDQALFELDKLTRDPQYAVGEWAFDNANFTHELAAMLDALADLVYVALGTAHLQGFPFREAWARVHEANMKKVASATASNAEERRKLKMIKPPGWEPPRHEDLVEDHAHPQEHKP